MLKNRVIEVVGCWLGDRNSIRLVKLLLQASNSCQKFSFRGPGRSWSVKQKRQVAVGLLVFSNNVWLKSFTVSSLNFRLRAVRIRLEMAWTMLQRWRRLRSASLWVQARRSPSPPRRWYSPTTTSRQSLPPSRKDAPSTTTWNSSSAISSHQTSERSVVSWSICLPPFICALLRFLLVLCLIIGRKRTLLSASSTKCWRK